jgi:pilus assembly protein Flp/PilA
MVYLLRAYMHHEAAVTAVEYGLIAALVALVIIGAVSSTGQHVSSTFSKVATSL